MYEKAPKGSFTIKDGLNRDGGAITVSTGGSSKWIHSFEGETLTAKDSVGNICPAKVVTVVDGCLAPNADGENFHLRAYLDNDEGIILGTQGILDELYAGNKPKVIIRLQSMTEYLNARDKAIADLKIEQIKPEGEQDAGLIKKLIGRSKSTYNPLNGLAQVVDLVDVRKEEEVEEITAATLAAE